MSTTVTLFADEAGPFSFIDAHGFTLKPRPDKHGLLPRYVWRRVKEGRAIAIPKGTTRLGLWIHGRSTWTEITLGRTNADGKEQLIRFGRGDNFDGWRFLTSALLSDDAGDGECRVQRIVVMMPEQQVHVQDLLTTPLPRIAICGLYALDAPPRDATYLPW